MEPCDATNVHIHLLLMYVVLVSTNYLDLFANTYLLLEESNNNTSNLLNFI